MSALEKMQNILNTEMKERFDISIGDTVNFAKMKLSPLDNYKPVDAKLCASSWIMEHDENVMIRKLYI